MPDRFEPKFPREEYPSQNKESHRTIRKRFRYSPFLPSERNGTNWLDLIAQYVIILAIFGLCLFFVLLSRGR